MTEDLTVAPGAADPTFGALMNWLIFKSFHRVETLDPNISFRHYTECLMCEATDLSRRIGDATSVHHITHKPDCILAKHLPRLRAMATKGAT
jgi:hypothetical protein